MKVTDYDLMAAIYLVMEKPMKLLEILKAHTDKNFCLIANSLINQSTSSPSDEEKEGQNKETVKVYKSLYLILGPIYVALGHRLPFVSGEQLKNFIEQQDAEADWDEYYRQFEAYNKSWYRVIIDATDELQKPALKSVIMFLSKIFVDALPEPIEPVSSELSQNIEDQIKDILGK